MLGLHRYTWAFSGCSEWGLVSSFSAQASHGGGFSHCRAWVLGHAGSVVVVCGLNCFMVSGIFSDLESNLYLLPLSGRFFITEPPGKQAPVREFDNLENRKKLCFARYQQWSKGKRLIAMYSNLRNE